jgi:phenylacetic acid degradation protein paaN
MSIYAVAEATDQLQGLVAQHQPILDAAIRALQERVFYAQYPEHPKPYGDDGMARGQAAYDAQVGQRFSRLRQPADHWLAAQEQSPYTRQALGISYPALKDADAYINALQGAAPSWRKASPAVRAALLIESLERMKLDFFEIALATQHTTGQAWMMSFQASGPHAADRALEAVAMGYAEQSRYPGHVAWTKQLGKDQSQTINKYFRTVPVGLALTVGCSTFPVWNTVPGLYASLVTGNPTVVKAHPLSIYAIAIVVARIQEVLAENGFDPHTVLLAPDTVDAPITKALAQHPAIKIIDFTGGNVFGDWLEALPGKTTFTEKAGVNSVILDSVDDLGAVMQNLAFSVSLYSGQMCTAPQNFYVPKGGIRAGGEHVSAEAVAEAFAKSVGGLTQHPKAGPAIGGAVQRDETTARVAEAQAAAASAGATVILPSAAIANAEFPEARTAAPLIVRTTADKRDLFSREWFGPIVFVIETDSTDHSLALAQEFAKTHGALSCAAYTTDPAVMTQIADGMAEAATPVAFNLTGQVFVNQNAGFSDFHGCGGNPAGNASYTDPAFVQRRFHFVEAKVG